MTLKSLLGIELPIINMASHLTGSTRTPSLSSPFSARQTSGVTMEKQKRARLKAAGWTVGTPREFLDCPTKTPRSSNSS